MSSQELWKVLCVILCVSFFNEVTSGSDTNLTTLRRAHICCHCLQASISFMFHHNSIQAVALYCSIVKGCWPTGHPFFLCETRATGWHQVFHKRRDNSGQKVRLLSTSFFVLESNQLQCSFSHTPSKFSKRWIGCQSPFWTLAARELSV